DATAAALDEAEEAVDLARIRGERAGLLEALGRGVEFLLSQGEDAVVGPPCGLVGRDLGHLGELRLCPHVVARLECREADVEGRDDLLVVRWGRGLVTSPAALAERREKHGDD